MVTIRECIDAHHRRELQGLLASNKLPENPSRERVLETVVMAEYEEFLFYQSLMNHNMWRRKRGGAIRQVSYYEE